MSIYEIRVKGHLDQRWSSWFDGLTITYDDEGCTILRGPLVDEAALHGVLIKVRDAHNLVWPYSRWENELFADVSARDSVSAIPDETTNPTTKSSLHSALPSLGCWAIGLAIPNTVRQQKRATKKG